MTEKLKSLAHKNWPYAGTGHAWRGFVSKTVITAKEAPYAYPGCVVFVDTEIRYQKLNFGPELT
jgi:hypothetical protein